MKFRFKAVALAAVALMLSVSFFAIVGNDRSEGAAESPSSVELSLYDIGEKDHSVTLYLGDTLTIKGYYHDGSNYGVYYSVSSVPSGPSGSAQAVRSFRSIRLLRQKITLRNDISA